ncbi:dihydroxyacetone kinase subunit L [Listeria monocytogenes]|uniref:phosphoenolpyruvate--glycerone phosphotransferase n=1 Tax=Marinilactibacillus piezotolerans TaxID=258723 RepID=A0A1I4BLB8_9LACT|nr:MULTISPECIES: dihydroxyacetone kinase subunit DhaL [Marinilactibacillus]EAH2637964.1 dihydroxyacetone kinase subunit L [Listeria monocytogenes]API88359.1 dihydroxyacetone kinase subunit L [Marinilactibacillus sp. 15R]EHD0417794.1 dihydroxyacetone kinase subunit L [Listeria monocytogenes]EIC1657341.1 dihydroxyacetone kinase subunit L [Listeria monocytogenes]SFK69662.1 dihydroxyacetone kinase DhaL subunit [Marinilactibacillus piezotolerans]
MDIQTGIRWMELFNEKVQQEKDYLTQLDTPIGDSDHGNNMSRGMAHVVEAIDTQSPNSLEELLKLVTTTLLSKVGGASGPLYGSAFMGMLKTYQGDGSSWSKVLQCGLESIQKRGKAEIGDKTMIDVWAPVVQAAENEQLTNEVIDEAVEATKPLKARKGRASYVGERSIGHIDPGAYSSALLFHAMLEAEAGQ